MVVAADVVHQNDRIKKLEALQGLLLRLSQLKDYQRIKAAQEAEQMKQIGSLFAYCITSANLPPWTIYII